MDEDGEIAGFFTEKGQDQINLCVNTQQTERGIDKHPFDLIYTKQRDVENRVKQDGEAAMKVKKTDFRAVV